MSRKPRLTLDEARAQVTHLTRAYETATRELEGARAALKQQQRHIHQLLRALSSSAPTPRKRRVAC